MRKTWKFLAVTMFAFTLIASPSFAKDLNRTGLAQETGAIADFQDQFNEDMGDLHEMVQEGKIDQTTFDKRAAKLQGNFDQAVSGQ